MGYDELLLGAAAPLLLVLCAIMLGLILCELTMRVGAQVVRRGGLAEQRGLALLKEWLSPAQLAQYEQEGHFEVMGSHSGKRYCIRHGRQANIIELDGRGIRVAAWCFGPEGDLATGDIMLAQKIALETDEPAALAIANRSR